LQMYEEVCKLQKLDISSSRIGDNGIIYLLEKIDVLTCLQYLLLDYIRKKLCYNTYKLNDDQWWIRVIKATDNFISEKIEKIIIDLLEKNKSITEFHLSGNRLSICCLNRIKKILSRNTRELENKEPNKLKVLHSFLKIKEWY
jgi:hypothetical protein